VCRDGGVVERIDAEVAVDLLRHAAGRAEDEGIGGRAAAQRFDRREGARRAGDVAAPRAGDVPGLGDVRPDQRVVARSAVKDGRNAGLAEREEIVAAA